MYGMITPHATRQATKDAGNISSLTLFPLFLCGCFAALLCVAVLQTSDPLIQDESVFESAEHRGEIKVSEHYGAHQNGHATVVGRIQGGVQQFLGINYATIPRRFDYPVLRNLPMGITSATAYGPWCSQEAPAGVNTSEDCLFLNIFAPPGTRQDSKRPVMVWIHGGANQAGASSAPGYDGSNLAQERGVIVVSINYRLGAFGQFASKQIEAEHPHLRSTGGMNWILDQVAALLWVRTHIHTFGGDADKVTIWGQSSGGYAVCAHLVSPLSKGLFRHAIMESGTCGSGWLQSKDAALYSALECQTAVGCSTLACMRDVPAWRLLKHCPLQRVSLDGLVLKKDPGMLLREGVINLPKGGALMVGYNTGDSLLGYPFFIGMGKALFDMSISKYKAEVLKFFPDHADLILKHYPPSESPVSNGKTMLLMNADACFKCPGKTLATLVADTHHKTYLYEYGYQPLPDDPQAGRFKGLIWHTGELGSVFGNPPTLPSYGGPTWNATLSAVMTEFFASFASTGTPTAPSMKAVTGDTRWPTYMPVRGYQRGMFFDMPGLREANFDEVTMKDRCYLWNDSLQTAAGRERLFDFCYTPGALLQATAPTDMDADVAVEPAAQPWGDLNPQASPHREASLPATTPPPLDVRVGPLGNPIGPRAPGLAAQRLQPQLNLEKCPNQVCCDLSEAIASKVYEKWEATVHHACEQTRHFGPASCNDEACALLQTTPFDVMTCYDSKNCTIVVQDIPILRKLQCEPCTRLQIANKLAEKERRREAAIRQIVEAPPVSSLDEVQPEGE